MPVAIYGIHTQKVDERLRPWQNTYYTSSDSLANAMSLGEYLLIGEQMVHHEVVHLVGVHAWQVGAAANFDNAGFDYNGLLTGGNPLPPWFTAQITMGAPSSYPGWKRYRGRYDRALYDGPDWSDTMLTILQDLADYLAEAPLVLCTRAGAVFDDFEPEAFPAPLQLNKKWYNRTP